MTGRALLALGCLLALHALSCAPPFLGGEAWRAFLRPAPDFAVLFAIASLGAAVHRPWPAALLAALLLLVSVAFGVAASLWPMFFDRPFALADLPHTGGLFHLLFDQRPDWVQRLAAVALVPAGLLAWWLLGWSFARSGRALGRRGVAVACIALQALVLAAVVRQSAGTAEGPLWHRSWLRALFDQVVRGAGTALDGEDAVEAPGPGLRGVPADLGGLAGADVHVLFVESYGRVALRHPDIGAALRGLGPELEAQLAARGFAAASGACSPAVRGGGSSLAHAEFLIGVPVPDYPTAERALRSSLPSLARRFAEAGYETVSVMPAMDRPYEPLQRFHGCGRQITQAELGYDGFRYHFGRMPDQYALHHLLAEVVAPAERPLFTFFVSVTSHLPCTYVPPYVADWEIDGDTFRGPPAATFATSWLDVVSNPDLVPAFTAALVYSLRTAVGFACRLERPSLVVVVGDHQPPVKRRLVPGDDSGDVVLHVFANRPSLLAPLSSLGLAPGLEVASDVEAFPMADFAARFLRAFSRPQEEVRGGQAQEPRPVADGGR